MSTYNIGFFENGQKLSFIYHQMSSNTNLGPVVQSIVSLTTLLRRQLVKFVWTTLSNTLLFFVEKM